MARHSRDAGLAGKPRRSPPKDPRFGAERERSATESGAPREDQEDRERRAYHARIRARQADAEDGDRGVRPPRR